MASSDFTQGELPWRTEFGSLLHLLRHEKNDAVLQQLARVHVADARAQGAAAKVPGNNIIVAGVQRPFWSEPPLVTA